MPVIPEGLFQIGVLILLLAIFLVIAVKIHWEQFEKPYQSLIAIAVYLLIAYLLVVLFLVSLDSMYSLGIFPT
tara:strand:- start:691 stop:909 length:219 start_codon:yes stop_codon:yes gene_type:complete